MSFIRLKRFLPTLLRVFIIGMYVGSCQMFAFLSAIEMIILSCIILDKKICFSYLYCSACIVSFVSGCFSNTLFITVVFGLLLCLGLIKFVNQFKIFIKLRNFLVILFKHFIQPPPGTLLQEF